MTAPRDDDDDSTLTVFKIARLQRERDLLLDACRLVIKVLDYRNCSSDPKAASYVNPAIVAADRSIAEARVHEAVAIVEGCPYQLGSVTPQSHEKPT